MKPASPRLQVLGAWVAVEQVDTEHVGHLIRPWTARAGDLFVARVLAIGADVGLRADGTRARVPFEVHDFVLVETMTGHPHMATHWPDRPKPGGGTIPGGIRPVDLRCDAFGGSVDRPVGLVPWYPDGLPACQRDHEAAARTRRGKALYDLEHGRADSLVSEADGARLAEMKAHEAWLKAYEASRVGCRRSRLMRPVFDPAAGEGIVAVVEDLNDLLALGCDPVWLADTLGVAAAS